MRSRAAASAPLASGCRNQRCSNRASDAATAGCSAGGGLVGAAVVSNPCCLNRSSVVLETPWRMGMVYNLILAARLRQARTHARCCSHDGALNLLAVGIVVCQVTPTLRAWCMEQGSL